MKLLFCSNTSLNYVFNTSSSESLTRCVLLTFTFRNNIFMSGFCLRETLSTRLCYSNEKTSYMSHLHLKNKVPHLLNLRSPQYLALNCPDTTDASVSAKRYRGMPSLFDCKHHSHYVKLSGYITSRWQLHGKLSNSQNS